MYDWTTNSWDTSTCEGTGWSTRCAKLDCHDTENTNFELVGIFKETDGIYDWAEQLFKHQGFQ